MKDKNEMTAQIAERLLYEGSEHAMCTNPLDDYFAMAGARPLFASTSTALWRGYVGRWEIVNDRLYLVGLQRDVAPIFQRPLETHQVESIVHNFPSPDVASPKSSRGRRK